MKTAYKQRLIIDGNVFCGKVENMKRILSVGDTIEIKSQPIKGMRQYYEQFSVKRLYPHYAVMEGRDGIQRMTYNVLALRYRNHRRKVTP